jgi:hypothetical protein
VTKISRVGLVEQLGDDENVILLEGPEFDAAIIGICERYGQPRIVCYDYEKVIKVLKKQGMTDEEAVEWWDFNIIGAWMGEETPCFLHRLKQ